MTEASRSPGEYWQHTLSFYRELIDRHAWNQTAMLELVECLARSSWAASIYSSTSHEALGLSMHERYEDRCHAPMVYLRYNGDTNMFEVIYQEGQGHTVSSEFCPRVDEPTWDRILAWLRKK